jgi:hypothetical protein
MVGVQPGQRPQWQPLTRHDSHVAQQMVERAAELARDSHARTRHAAVLVNDGSLLAWGQQWGAVPGGGPLLLPGRRVGRTPLIRLPRPGRHRSDPEGEP